MKNRVIDGDNQRVLERFDPMDADKVIERYRSSPKWSEVEFDCDGDIICFEDSDDD
jgi:hypothetical protein